MQSPGTSPDGGIKFGVFELDPASGELRKHGIRVRLQDQPFKILLALLEKPGGVVTREELRLRVWGDGTFVDFDHGLSAAVNRLREALSDSAEKPRYVETLARRGYRFVAPVDTPPLPAPAAQAPAPAPKQSRRKLVWAAAALLAVLGLSAAYWLRRPHSPPGPIRVVPLTTYPGLELQPAFSPDGKQVAFTWNGEKGDNTDAYVKMTGAGTAGTPLRLTTDPAPDVAPAWSPDGRQIAFVRWLGGQPGIWVVSPLGGGERKLSDMPAMHSSLDWSPDGKWLAAGVQEPRETSGIFLVPVEQGEKRRLTSNSAGVDHSPQFSRDGKALAYVSCTGVYSCDVFILELASGWAPKGQPRRLTGPSASVQGIAWSADGQSIVYATSTAAAASHYLWRISVSGSAEPESLALGDSRARYPAIAREGRRLAYSRYTADSDIW